MTDRPVKTTETYYLTILEARRLRWRCQQGWFPPKAVREVLLLDLVFCWQSLAFLGCRHIILVSGWNVFTCLSFPLWIMLVILDYRPPYSSLRSCDLKAHLQRASSFRIRQHSQIRIWSLWVPTIQPTLNKHGNFLSGILKRKRRTEEGGTQSKIQQILYQLSPKPLIYQTIWECSYLMISFMKDSVNCCILYLEDGHCDGVTFQENSVQTWCYSWV